MNLIVDKGWHRIGFRITHLTSLPELFSNGVYVGGNRSHGINAEGITLSIGNHVQSRVCASCAADRHTTDNTSHRCDDLYASLLPKSYIRSTRSYCGIRTKNMILVVGNSKHSISASCPYDLAIEIPVVDLGTICVNNPFHIGDRTGNPYHVGCCDVGSSRSYLKAQVQASTTINWKALTNSIPTIT